MTLRDINAVLKDHDKELLAIPGVVGVYVGLLPDDKTPCLKVMVVKETEDLKRRIPKSIEGYPVLIEESGVIRPLKGRIPTGFIRQVPRPAINHYLAPESKEGTL